MSGLASRMAGGLRGQLDALVARRIAGQHGDARAGGSGDAGQRLQRPQLVADQRLGRVQVQRARARACVRIRSSVGSANARLLPLAVGLASTTFLPSRSASTVADLVRVQLLIPCRHQRPRQRRRQVRPQDAQARPLARLRARSCTSTSPARPPAPRASSRRRCTSASAELGMRARALAREGTLQAEQS